MSLIYVASPYTPVGVADPEKVKNIHQLRYIQVSSFCASIINVGLDCFSPIVHWHPIAMRYRLPTDIDFWWKRDRVMLDRADELWLLKLVGWETSAGIRREKKYAEQRGLTITNFYLDKGRYKSPSLSIPKIR